MGVRRFLFIIRLMNGYYCEKCSIKLDVPPKIVIEENWNFWFNSPILDKYIKGRKWKLCLKCFNEFNINLEREKVRYYRDKKYFLWIFSVVLLIITIGMIIFLVSI